MGDRAQIGRCRARQSLPAADTEKVVEEVARAICTKGCGRGKALGEYSMSPDERNAPCRAMSEWLILSVEWDPSAKRRAF